MASCCTCAGATDITSQVKNVNLKKLPLICVVQGGDDLRNLTAGPSSRGDRANSDILLDKEAIRKHFKIPPRPLYLDPSRRPLISFPMTQEDGQHFSFARKYKINQQILDGNLDPSEAISAPCVFPYATTTSSEFEKRKEIDEDDEIIYVFQLPDWEYKCPVHNETIRTPRVLLRTGGKSKKSADVTSEQPKQVRGPVNKAKPWLLSRHTDFDLLSQW